MPNADNPAPSRRGKKGMTLYFDPPVHRVLKQLALDENTSINALLIKSVDLMLAKYGKKPVTIG
ncbi:ribbon-helix-helix domain-containing protein [Hyphomicrobium sp. ghe19]|uniref:ribbon-helix-helix domain-containing protein n=1 Tax=Hyphomicrobium sp. ghe19 TaxID=2682968 RepID=UPI0030D45B4C